MALEQTRKWLKNKMRLTSWLSATFGFLITIYFFRPGFMTPDPTAQLAEARSGIYTDLHPPLTALLWRYLDAIIPGPLGMLVFHNLMFWAALAILGSLFFSK